MSKTHHVIYIPGLGDHNSTAQIRLINRWQKLGVEPHYFPVGWTNDEPFKSKLGRLTKLIDELSAQPRQVSLVGTSAGAGLALNAYTERKSKVSGIVYICGKLLGLEGVSPKYFKANPAFYDSLKLTQANMAKLSPEDKAKMLSLRPIYDDVVPIPATQIPGVRSKLMVSAWHVISIGVALIFYKRAIVNFLKQQSVE